MKEVIRKRRAELIGQNLGEEFLAGAEQQEDTRCSDRRESQCYLATLDRLNELDIDDPYDMSNFLAETWPSRCEEFNDDELLWAAEAFAMVIRD